MQETSVLLSIAEVSVAFAGFASVVVLFQHRDPQSWPPAVVVRLRTMIEGGLTTLFSALLPFVLHNLGLEGGALWSASSVLLGIWLLAFAALVWRRARAPLASGQLNRWFSVVVGLITAIVTASLFLNAVGIGFPRVFGPYLLAVTWSLAFASLMFVRVVVLPTGVSRTGG